MKSKILRLLLIGAAGLAAVLLLALLTISPSRYSDRVAEIIQNRFSSPQMKLTLQGPSLTYTSFSAQTMRLFWPRAPFWIDFKDASIRLALRCLAKLDICPAVSSKLYGGNLNYYGRVAQDLFSGDITLEGLKLEDHPQLAGLQLAGTLSVSLTDLYLTSNEEGSGVIEITIKDGAKKISHQWEPRDLPGKIEIPAFSNLQLHLKIPFDSKSGKIEDATLESSLGGATLGGDLVLNAGRLITGLNLEGKVHLTKDGKASLGPWLPVISGGAISEENSKFSFKITGPSVSPRIKFSR